MDRRTFLAASAATVAVMPFVSAEPAVAAVAKAAPKSWVVGTPGEYNWHHCWGDTEHEAKLDWCNAQVGNFECEHGLVVPGEDCDCEVCVAYRDCDADRVEAWDGKGDAEIGPGDWLRAGLGHVCSRCGYETDPDEGHGVGKEAVCGDCMKLEDWDKVDPERAAEMRAELAELEAE